MAKKTVSSIHKQLRKEEDWFPGFKKDLLLYYKERVDAHLKDSSEFFNNEIVLDNTLSEIRRRFNMGSMPKEQIMERVTFAAYDIFSSVMIDYGNLCSQKGKDVKDALHELFIKQVEEVNSTDTLS